jgi:flagellar M-ring protein FliF
MSDLTPANAPSVLAPLTDPAGGSPLVRLQGFIGQPAVKKSLPWFLGVAALGGAGLSWAMLAPAPQRLLYVQLDDAERASVVATLDKGQIGYRIDPGSGALTVAESDLYKARMLVAQNGSLATPDTTSDALDKLPMGASRALESERLLAAREHELMLTIKEIDGVEAVRVQIADAAKSVFVRDNIAPSASVMLWLADGRQLSQEQVSAIVNLVAGSVQGMTPDAVRVADQHGHLLSARLGFDKAGGANSDRLELQTRMEDKLREQVNQLLTPMLGDGNFSSEIQVDLDMDQVTSARESYDKTGALRSETQQQSQTSAAPVAGGVPGVLSNTPPPSATASPGAPTGTLSPGAPTGTLSPGATPAPATNGESSASRNYELGREVAVSNAEPGKIKRLSVAVALSARAMKKFRASDIDQIRQLVSAAVGADNARGDQVAVMVRSFDANPIAAVPFYETSFFAMALRYGAALLAVLLVLLLGVRPLVRALKNNAGPAADEAQTEAAGPRSAVADANADTSTHPAIDAVDTAMLGRHVGMAQQIVDARPVDAVLALRQMLAPGDGAQLLAAQGGAGHGS